MSWLSIPPDSPFSINNIPFGIISYKPGESFTDDSPRPAIAIGSWILDLRTFAGGGGFTRLPGFAETSVFEDATTLNPFAQLGRRKHRLVREYLQAVLSASTPFPEVLRDDVALASICLHPSSEVVYHLPMTIGDYTDFYAGRNHAFNVGELFRGRAAALQPNYEHLPVGYHGRASSVVVSGTDIVRPVGQVACGVVRASEKLDFELEIAAFVCKDSELGERVSVNNAGEYLFGVVLMNDWSGVFSLFSPLSRIVAAVAITDLGGGVNSEGYPSVGVCPARTIHEQVLCNVRVTVGRSHGRSGAIPHDPPAAQQRRSAGTLPA
jgi:fumarylacetoacetase